MWGLEVVLDDGPILKIVDYAAFAGTYYEVP
jgi:hypothetical protein